MPQIRKKKGSSSGLDRKQKDLLIQQRVQQEAMKLSIEHELGTLKSEKQHQKPVFPRLSGCMFSLLMLFCAVISLIFLIALLPNDFPAIICIFMLVLFVLLSCLWVRSFSYPSRHSREFLYERGWVHIQCKDEQIIETCAINWRDVAIIWHETVSGDGGVLHDYRLQDYHGNLLKGPKSSEQMTLPYLFPQILSAYKRGASVPFGPLAVHQGGIVYKGKLLSWHDFGSLDRCDSSAKLSIYHRKDPFHRRAWAAVYCHQVPNVALLHHLIRFRLFSSYPEPGRISLSSVPARPVVGRRATIIYSGHLIFSARSMTMHWGYNNWNGITDTEMTLQRDGTWKATILVPSGATGLNMAFHDQGNTWDNNSSDNYNLGVVNVRKK